MPAGTLLLTGATGFLGKVVLEQLLRRRAELGVDRVLALVRAEDAAAARRRLEREVLGAACFDGLAAAERAYVEAVAGDVGRPGCGLDAADRARVVGTVSHVVHCAASIDFDLPLGEAAAINVGGALHMLELARAMPSLASLVAVSTAYVTPADPERPPLAERLAPLPEPAETLWRRITAGEIEGAELLRRTGHPNTYTLTKCVAEHLLCERAGGVPLRIVRPSIISATWREPFPGWIDSHAAFAGFVALVGLGHLRVVVGRPETPLDVVPADLVARRVLEAAFAPAPHAGAVPIHHAVSGLALSPTIADCRTAIEGHFGRHRLGTGPRMVTVAPDGTGTRLRAWRHHGLPLRAAALGLRALGRGRTARSARRLEQRIAHLNRVFPYFTQQGFDFRGAPPPAGFDPRSYLDVVCAGVRRHLLRDDPTESGFAGRDDRLAPSPWRAALRHRGAIPAHRVASLALAPLFRRSISSATADLTSFERALAARRPGERLVVVATHRSYFDFLLLPYLFFRRPDLGVLPPHIAADESFARIPALGRVAAACGAFFLQRGVGREEKGLTEQVHRLVAADRALLFFIEGRRSRTRRMLPPKRGLLRALQSTGESFLLLPVGVSYDRMPEEASFAGELAGGEKAPMRLGALAGWLRSVRRGEVDLGRVHVACGPPLRLGLGSDVEAVATDVMASLESSLVTTRFQLHAFLQHHPVAGCDPAWLEGALRPRGVRVLESPLDAGAELAPATAAGFRHAFAGRLRRRDGDTGTEDPRLEAFRAALEALDAEG